MTLAKTSDAIGAVTAVIDNRLTAAGLSIAVGFPRKTTQKSLYLFPYEVTFDPSLANISLDEGQPPPIWLVIKYLLITYDEDTNNEYKPLRDMGLAIRALQDLNYLDFSDFSKHPDPWVAEALQDNPEPLKLTFDEASPNLISNILGHTNEYYQFAITFQIRPVLIALAETPSYSLLVGIDYTKDEPREDKYKGVNIPVDALNFPIIERIFLKDSEINPDFEFANEEITTIIEGSNLTLPQEEREQERIYARLGSVEYLVSGPNDPNRLEWRINVNDISNRLSAGSYPVSIVQKVNTKIKAVNEANNALEVANEALINAIEKERQIEESGVDETSEELIAAREARTAAETAVTEASQELIAAREAKTAAETAVTEASQELIAAREAKTAAEIALKTAVDALEAALKAAADVSEAAKKKKIDKATETAKMEEIDKATETAKRAVDDAEDVLAEKEIMVAEAEAALAIAKAAEERVKRISNTKIIHLRPFLQKPDVPSNNELTLTGTLLGRKEDVIFVAFYNKGRVVRVYDDFRTTDYFGDQKTLTIKLSRLTDKPRPDLETPAPPALPAGTYRIILRINNQQARQSPEVIIE